MSAHPSLATLLESFFRSRLTKQRNASPSTIASYRDALRMLILFAAQRTGRKPCALAAEDLDRDLILAFLDELEKKRKNTIQTRNARLTAIRSFFHHVAVNDPASLGIAQRVLAIPIKKSHTEVTHHLSRHELDALIDAPDQRTPRGRRDRTLLLFLGRTGARISEALAVNAGDLQLDRPRQQVLLHGKGRKDRIVPIPDNLAKALKTLMPVSTSNALMANGSSFVPRSMAIEGLMTLDCSVASSPMSSAIRAVPWTMTRSSRSAPR